MRAARSLSWALLLAGLASLAYAGLRGDVEVFLVLVVPVVAGTGPWAGLGLLATIAGGAGLLWTSVSTGAPPEGPTRGPGPGAGREPEASERRSETRTKGGGVILIGPIPIAWGSDRSTLGWLVVGGIALTLAAIGLALVMRP